MIGDSGFHSRDIWEQLPVVNILNQLIILLVLSRERMGMGEWDDYY